VEGPRAIFLTGVACPRWARDWSIKNIRCIDGLVNKTHSLFEFGGNKKDNTVHVRDAASGGAVRRGLLRLLRGLLEGGWHEAAEAFRSKQGEIGTKDKG
jgi:hypothetical protein